MAKAALTLVDGRAVNSADRALADLLESALVAAEALDTETITRTSFWTRLFDGAARGNALARHLAERETVWLTAHQCAIGGVHGALSTILLYCKAEGLL